MSANHHSKANDEIANSIQSLNEIFQHIPHGAVGLNSLGMAKGIVLQRKTREGSHKVIKGIQRTSTEYNKPKNFRDQYSH